MGINDQANDWRAQAYGGVPDEYANRGLHEKYLRGDNEDAGYSGAADDLDELARTAWHPVSDPPTEADSDESSDVMVLYPDGTVGFVKWWNYEEWNPAIRWARPSDVILLPPA